MKAPQNGWFITEKLIDMDDLGAQNYFRKFLETYNSSFFSTDSPFRPEKSNMKKTTTASPKGEFGFNLNVRYLQLQWIDKFWCNQLGPFSGHSPNSYCCLPYPHWMSFDLSFVGTGVPCGCESNRSGWDWMTKVEFDALNQHWMLQKYFFWTSWRL